MHRPTRTGRAVPPRRGGRFDAAALAAVFAVAALGVFVPAAPAHAQDADDPSPLTKSQLIRLVTSSTYSQAEIIRVVEASCLSFEPTDRDLVDLSSLGAGAPVLDAVRACGGPSAVAEAEPGATPSVTAQVTVGQLAVASRSLSGAVGTSVAVTAILQRDGSAVAGQRLILRGSGAVIGGPGTDLIAATDSSGQVSFSVPTGTAARVYPLTIVAESGRLESDRNFELTVRPGPASRADFSPAQLALRPNGDASPIEATIRDEFDNAIPGIVVALALPADAGGATLPGTSDSRGVAAFAVVTTGLSAGDRLELLSDGSPIAQLTVEAAPDPIAAEKVSDPSPDTDAAVAAAGAGAVAAGAGAVAGANLAAAGPSGGAGGLSVDSLIREGRQAESAKNYTRAELFYRQALEVDPASTEAQKAMGDVSMVRDQPENAMLWYQAAVGTEPDNAQLWLALGMARTEAGFADEANAAFRRVIELDPDNQEAQQMLAGVGPREPLLHASLWGGNTFDNSRSTGLMAAQVIFWPVPALSVWGRYDNSLALYEWALVRGPDDVEGFYGGAGLDWGSRRSLSTRFEIGRREPPGAAGVYQNFYHLEQSVRVTSGVNAVRVAAGGYLGRWFDRDDWQIYTKAEIPVGAELTLLPALYVGETVGSAFGEIGRVPANEFRGYLTFDFRPVRAVRLQPSFGVGSVSSDDTRLNGTLVDALFQLTVGSGVARGEMFLRYQDSPGVESFAVLALGLTLGVPRGGL